MERRCSQSKSYSEIACLFLVHGQMPTAGSICMLFILLSCFRMGSLIDDIKSWKLDSSVQQIFLDWLQEPAQGFNIHERTPDYFWGITENDLKSTFNLNQRKQIAQHIKPGGKTGTPPSPTFPPSFPLNIPKRIIKYD